MLLYLLLLLNVSSKGLRGFFLTYPWGSGALGLIFSIPVVEKKERGTYC